jgi:solute carrier family 12 sodium/potassium/chloride transporter 2
MTTSPAPKVEPPRRGLGTFGGVFTPSILTILGVIMYLRFGWVVGNAGLRNTLIIVTIATAITLLTGLSIAQISTDQEIRTGGAYYMVSRSLGSEIGGAIGIPLYLAQALSVALYTLGFAESVHAVAPSVPIRPLALGTTVLVTVLALVSARAAIRAQYVIMAVIALSLLLFFLGTNHVSAPVLPGHGGRTSGFQPEPFWGVFAVFFPAVTGIMAGVNMSGDLAQPRKSIPRGTLAAIAVSYVVYMTIPIVLDKRADAASLVDDPLIMRQLALWGPAILLGVWGATLSSALGSMLGAPRILQALARDRVLPGPMRVFGRGSGPDDEPRLGTYFSLALVLGVVAVGDLDAVAPVLTMFFLASYAVVNLVSASERFLRNPSFRPTFRVHWSLSFLGAVGCGAVMFLINPLATIVAMVIVVAIWGLLSRRRARAQWGDIRQGLWINLIRWAAAHVRPSTHAKSWRPNILVLAGSPTKRFYLIDLANALSHDRGLLTIATILPEPAPSQRKRQLAETVRDHLAERKVDALVRVVSAPTPYVGASVLVEAYGLGGLVPNTVLLGDGETTSDAGEYATMIHRMHDAGRNVVVVRAAADTTFAHRRQIDVWLHSMRDNGALMIMLANTLRGSKSWRKATISVRMIVAKPEAADGIATNLRTIFTNARLVVDVDVIVDARPTGEVIGERSSSADLSLIGLPDPCAYPDEFPQRLSDMLASIQTSSPLAFVLASNDVDLQSILD